MARKAASGKTGAAARKKTARKRASRRKQPATPGRSREKTPPFPSDPVTESEAIDQAADATARDLAIGWRLGWSRVKNAVRRAFTSS